MQQKANERKDAVMAARGFVKSALAYRSVSRGNPVETKKPIPIVEDKKRCVVIDYTNHRGERRERAIKPIEIEYTQTEWHPTKQWLLRARDMEDGAVKGFAMADIHGWRKA